MRPDRQRFVNILATFGAVLCRVARTHSDHLTTSTFSLADQDNQKRAPRRIKNALCQSTSRQSPKVQILDHDRRIPIHIMFCGLEMKVAALTLNLEMSLRHTARHLATAVAALLPGAQAFLTLKHLIVDMARFDSDTYPAGCAVLDWGTGETHMFSCRNCIARAADWQAQILRLCGANVDWERLRGLPSHTPFPRTDIAGSPTHRIQSP